MGYKRKNTYLLEFEGEEFEGLEIEMRSMSVKTSLDLTKTLQGADDGDVDSVKQGMEIFVKHLVGWNLEDDDDTPLPATLETVYDLDMAFVMTIIAYWMEAVSGISADLGKGSTSGETSAEVSIPMETL